MFEVVWQEKSSRYYCYITIRSRRERMGAGGWCSINFFFLLFSLFPSLFSLPNNNVAHRKEVDTHFNQVLFNITPPDILIRFCRYIHISSILYCFILYCYERINGRREDMRRRTHTSGRFLKEWSCVESAARAGLSSPLPLSVLLSLILDHYQKPLHHIQYVQHVLMDNYRVYIIIKAYVCFWYTWLVVGVVHCKCCAA